MNIKTRALLIAAGVGFVIQFIVSLLGSAVQLGPMLTGSGGLPTDPSGLMSVLGIVICLCALIVDVGIGALYAYLASREGALTLADGALGGAATGLLTRFISGLIGACIGILLVPLIISQTVGDVPPDAAGVVMGAGMAGGVIGAVIGVCVGLIIGGIGGAVGGAITGAVLSNTGQSQTPA
jgi:hypothetical protein